MSHRIRVKTMEIKIQLAMGRYTRQFFEPNSKSPGSRNSPTLPSSTIRPPSAAIITPITISHLPICCGPKSIFDFLILGFADSEILCDYTLTLKIYARLFEC